MKEFIKKLISRLEESCWTQYGINENGKMNEVAYDVVGLLKTIEIVNQLAEEYNNGWIPCSVELPPQPEENPEFEGKLLELYMVAMREEKYPFRAFWNGRNFTDGISVVKPIAWKPLDIFQKGENK